MDGKKRRGRPRGTTRPGATVEKQNIEEVGSLNSDDFRAVEFLSRIPALGMKFAKALRDPEVKKVFVGNTKLLMGMYDLTIDKLRQMAGCSQSTLSRLLAEDAQSAIRIERASIYTLYGIATALRISLYTLLYVDLRAKILDVIAEEEKKAGVV